MDIRHAPSKQDVEMYEYLRHYGLDGLVVATKADKISRNQMARQMKMIRQTLGLSSEDIVIPVSALKKTGIRNCLTSWKEYWGSRGRCIILESECL